MSLPPGPNLAPVEQRVAPRDPLPPRPGAVRAAVALMAFGAALALADAVVTLVAWDRGDIEGSLQDAGIEPGDLDGFLTIVRVGGFAVGLVTAGLWVLHAVGAHRGRGWVRPWATVLAGMFVLSSLTDIAAAGSTLGFAYLMMRTVVAIVASAVLWLPSATVFFRAAARLR